ncbi:MAG: hypothetical protein KJO76_09060 [Gammaproteobacteria bacterium]|nr:hypothetical protein [Gammaproteobacteria bacterium]MBT8443539.1 hypothetical protein [Gammaproteobacteria bacterium]NND37881.1 hypothetical protein [Gammaproteobacteria bacterium]
MKFNKPSIAAVSTCLLTLSLMTSAFGEEGHAVDEAEKRNTIGVFVGFTSEERRERGLALGIEGGHYFTESFAISGVLEYTFGDIDALVGAVPLVYRTGEWRFHAGPGFESGETTDGTEFLVRVGTEYGFEAGSIEIAPQLNIDFVDGDAVFVVGVLFARPF